MVLLLSKDHEYTLVNRRKYKQYRDEANLLLEHISDYFGIDILKINYSHVISYINRNFDISFIFYDDIPFEGFGVFKADNSWIRYPDLLPQPTFEFLDSVFVENVSGTTIISGNKYAMFINQCAIKSRVIFSVLHEIVHIYFHSYVRQVSNAFASLNTDTLLYKDDAIEYENEANIIASILFLSDEKLFYLINDKKMTFKEICVQEEISSPALHNRIKNYLIYNCFCVPNYATTIVLQFRDGNDKTLLEVIN